MKDFSKPFYSAKHINHMIEIYRNVIMDVVQGWKPENLICFVLEKSKPQKTDIRYKNGFHLHLPWLYLIRIDQEVHIQPRIQEAVEEEKVFADLGIAHSSKNVDKDLYKKHWLLYGCRKASTNEAYKVTRIVDHRGDDLQIDEIFKYHKLYDTDECEIKIDKPAEYYLPRILSVLS